MKIKIDENMPRELKALLATYGHDADTTPDEGLAGRKDDVIWAAAQAESRFLITQDLDFSDVRIFVPGAHCGLLLLRLREPGREAIVRRIRALLDAEDIANWAGCFVLATDHKVRIRRPSR